MTNIESLQRPEGFPLSENELHGIMKEVLDIISHGGMHDLYDEWVLRGTPGQPPHQTITLGIFPTIISQNPGYIFEHEVVVFDQISKPIAAYWREAATLPFSNRITQYESLYFAQQRGHEQDIFKKNLTFCLGNLLPTALVLFSRPYPDKEEFAYMLSPRIVPPSVTYRHLMEQLQVQQQQ